MIRLALVCAALSLTTPALSWAQPRTAEATQAPWWTAAERPPNRELAEDMEVLSTIVHENMTEKYRQAIAPLVILVR